MNDGKDAEQLVVEYFEHLSAERWREAARLLDPLFLHHFREREMRGLRLRPTAPLSVEEYLERDPELPREVAEHWVRLRSQHPPPRIADFFAGVESELELATLDDVELFARHLEAVDYELRYRKHLAELARQYPEFRDQLEAMMIKDRSLWWFDVVGSVVSGQRSFVLFEIPNRREGAVPWYEPTPSVAVVIDRGHGWRIATDPSPFSGVGVFLSPVTVLDPKGESVQLRLRPD